MNEEEKAIFGSIAERLDKLDKLPTIVERIEAIFRSIAERVDKLDKLLTILERIEARQIVVKEEVEQEIKDHPVVGSFASRDK